MSSHFWSLKLLKRHKKRNKKTVEKKGPKNDPKKAGQKMLPRRGVGRIFGIDFSYKEGWLKKKSELMVHRYSFASSSCSFSLCFLLSSFSSRRVSSSVGDFSSWFALVARHISASHYLTFRCSSYFSKLTLSYFLPTSFFTSTFVFIAALRCRGNLAESSSVLQRFFKLIY